MKITDHKLPEGIALTFRVPEGNIKHPLILLCHGFCGTLGMDELIAKAWRFVRERFRSYQTELKSRGIKRARARRDANRERQDIVTLVKRQLTREISEGRFTANREAVKREVERRVKERMILSRNRNYSRLATASP